MGLGLYAPPETGQLAMDLSGEERTELALCEAVIERGRQAFLEVGGALMTIQEKRLYRATHTTFDAYCREKWQIGKSYAYDMIAAYGIVENVRHSGQTEALPENPKQALALRGVAPEEQGAVMAKAVGTAPEGGVTAAHIEETANRHLGKPESVDAVTMAALSRAFSPDLHQGRIEPPVLVNGRLYVTQTKRAEAYGEEIERGEALCFQAVEMDWWIDQQNPVVRPEQWEQEFQSGKRKSADDVRGLRVVATGVQAPATCYYVLTGEKVTFVYQRAGKTEPKPPPASPAPSASAPRTVAVEAAFMETIAKSFSTGDTYIERGSIAAPFSYQGNLYVCMGGMSQGGWKKLTAYRVTPLEGHAGATFSYGQRLSDLHSLPRETADVLRERLYDCVRVEHKGKPYVLRGPEIVFVPLETPVEAEGTPPVSPENVRKSEPEIGTSDASTEDAGTSEEVVLREDLSGNARMALRALGERLTACHDAKEGCDLTVKEVRALHAEVRRLQTIEKAYAAIVKPTGIEDLRLQLELWQKRAVEWQEENAALQREKTELVQEVATLREERPIRVTDGIPVTGRDYRLLVALAERKRPGQTDTLPAEYLSLLINQRADQAGIELPDERPRCALCKTELEPAQTEAPVIETWREQSGTSMFLHEGNTLLAGKVWYCADCAPQLLSQGNLLSREVLERRFA